MARLRSLSYILASLDILTYRRNACVEFKTCTFVVVYLSLFVRCQCGVFCFRC